MDLFIIKGEGMGMLALDWIEVECEFWEREIWREPLQRETLGKEGKTRLHAH